MATPSTQLTPAEFALWAALLFLVGVVVGIALDRWVLHALVDLWVDRARRPHGR